MKAWFNLYIIMITWLFTGCKEQKDNPELVKEEISETTADSISKIQLTGNYLSAEYDKRDEGYDWIGVNVSNASQDELKIKIRSRADKKKPTCTFDAEFYMVEESKFSTVIKGKEVLIEFNNDDLTIKTAQPEDDSVLYFYC